MKHDLNIVDQPLLKLGPKVVEWPTMGKAEYDLISRASELASFESINFGRLRGITEAECRQIKPKAQCLPAMISFGMAYRLVEASLTRHELEQVLGVANTAEQPADDPRVEVKPTSPQEAQSLVGSRLPPDYPWLPLGIEAHIRGRGMRVTRVRTISPGCAFATWVKT